MTTTLEPEQLIVDPDQNFEDVVVDPTRKVTALGRIFGIGPQRVARWQEKTGEGQFSPGASLGLGLFTKPTVKKAKPKVGVDADFGFPVARGDKWGLHGQHSGRQALVAPAPEHRASTKQLCGLWPWGVGAAAPIVGTPLGTHLRTGSPVCYDAYNWFKTGKYISNPSTFIMGLPGFGKSTLSRRMVIGKVAQGVTPLILGDLKPDYVEVVRALGGQIITIGHGEGKINPLDVGALGRIMPELERSNPELAAATWKKVIARQVLMVSGLVQIVRRDKVADFEETLIGSALRRMYAPDFVGDNRYTRSSFDGVNPPILSDLIESLMDGTDDMILDAAADNRDEYNEATKPLRRALRSVSRGPFGEIFNGQSTVGIDVDAPAVCIDVHAIDNGDSNLMAAVLLTCWSDGFGAVDAAHTLFEAGLAPNRNFMVVLDEMWRVLGAGVGLVDRVNELTRLNRTMGLELVEIVHTFKDLKALRDPSDIPKAIGFIERAGALIVGALPKDEMLQLAEIKPFTVTEIDMVSGWSSTTAMMSESPRPGQSPASPPGQGNFLIKVGESGAAGIPLHVQLTQTELNLGVHDTNQRFKD